MPRLPLALLLIPAALVLAGLGACRCLDCYLAADFSVVTEPGGGIVRLLDPEGDGPAEHVEPFRVQRIAERLTDIDGSLAARLRVAGVGPTTVGRVVVEAAPNRSPDRQDDVETLEIVRCESEDGGAWWYDGVLVRARPAVPEHAQLVVQVGHASAWYFGERAILGPDARWRGAAVTLPPDRAVELRSAAGVWGVAAAAGCCVQISEDPAVAPDSVQLTVGEGLEGVVGVRSGSELGVEVMAGGGRVLLAGDFDCEVFAAGEIVASIAFRAADGESGPRGRPGLWLRVTRQQP